MLKVIDILVNKAITVLSNYRDKREQCTYVADNERSYAKLANKKELSKEQVSEIQAYYQKLIGRKIPTVWHRYFSARIGVYSKLYVPTSEYKTNIVGRLNVYPLKRAYTDKNVTDMILPNAKQPKILMKNMNGYYYVNGQAVSKEEAAVLCKDLGDVIIKPSLTARGKGVQKIHVENGMTDMDGKSLMQVFDSYKSDFLLQELVKQHPEMSALNPSSINTIRIMTYRKGMDVYVVYTVIRIGRKGQPIDNESAGGISTVIHEDGTLGKYAFGAPGVDNVEFTDSGIMLEGYVIPSFSKALDFVKHQHLQLPFFNLVGWDIAIEEDGEPTMIEFNVTPDLSQSANGPAFGQYTEMIIGDAMKKKNTYSRLLQELMWK